MDRMEPKRRADKERFCERLVPSLFTQGRLLSKTLCGLSFLQPPNFACLRCVSRIHSVNRSAPVVLAEPDGVLHLFLWSSLTCNW